MRKSGSPPFWKKSVQHVPIYSSQDLASKRAVMAWLLEPSALPFNRSWLFPLYRDERGKPRCRSLLRALYMVDSAPTLQTAAKRLIDMLVAKVKREPFESEMLPTSFESVPMPSGVN
jgi:hypothetical protein